MGVFDIKIAMEEEGNAAHARASEIYSKQISSIANIMTTDGYTEIKAYFEREAESAKESLTTANVSEIISLQERYKLANGFIQFLNNFESKVKK